MVPREVLVRTVLTVAIPVAVLVVAVVVVHPAAVAVVEVVDLHIYLLIQ
jgi:hypothetical protein